MRVACVSRVPAMSRLDELRAKAQKLLAQAKAAKGSSESLVYVMHSMECDNEAERLEQDEGPGAAAGITENN